MTAIGSVGAAAARARERAGRVGAHAARGVRSGARAALRPSGLRGVAVESAWLAAHAVLYPLGVAAERSAPSLARYRLADLPPVQRGLLIGDVEAAATPILLVHGLIDNRSVFTLLRRGLRRRGFGRVHTFNFPVLTRDLRVAARALAAQVEQLCEETGYERLHIVGHSLGGLVARYYVQRLGGDARVHTLATLGTPHGGTLTAHLLPHPICRQLRPGSAVLAELAEPCPGLRTRFLCFASDLDQMVVPTRAAQLEHPDIAARNIRLRGVGHLSLPIHGDVVREICRALAHLDTDGSTVTAGVTTLEPAPAEPDPAPAATVRAQPRTPTGRHA